MPKKLAVALVVAVALVRCSGSSPSAPSRTEDSSGASGAVHSTAHSTVSPMASPTPFVNLPPVGQFRVHPTPDGGGNIFISPGGTVKVNAAHFDDADGDDLTLRVDWGDGTMDKQLCGSCRLAHVYPDSGTFTLKGDISDGHLNDQSVRARAKVDQTWTVHVASALFCQSLSLPKACPSGATRFCDSSPIVGTNINQALLACNACVGAAGKCVALPFGANFTVFTPPFFNSVTFDTVPTPCGPPGAISVFTFIFPSCNGRWAP